MHEDDKPLLERLRNSDMEAFRLLFEKYQPILFRYALASIRDPDTAHDIVQETFLRVWNHRTSLKPDLSFIAYLFRISGNLVRDHAKHREVRSRLETNIPPAAPSLQDNPETASHSNMLQEKIAEVIQTKLPVKCREVFLLSRIEGLSNTEIGAALNISVKTVENQITRAQKILRKHLHKYV
ncbi:MAG: RNA polymerase sigma-70 factor [Bacteroidetes bacterium]|nr:RNA polymerase sigma-70 factor [Bacteroidota bacterium]MCW5895035.1 RNA polymerase sigma-70 factor [Bacteroidota bacterium]